MYVSAKRDSQEEIVKPVSDRFPMAVILNLNKESENFWPLNVFVKIRNRVRV